MSDVDSPSHYLQGGIECKDAIRAALTPEEYRGWCKGCSMKYLWRERYKSNSVQDLEKAAWFATELANVLKEEHEQDKSAQGNGRCNQQD